MKIIDIIFLIYAFAVFGYYIIDFLTSYLIDKTNNYQDTNPRNGLLKKFFKAQKMLYQFYIDIVLFINKEVASNTDSQQDT